jgi:hypothetical protein
MVFRPAASPNPESYDSYEFDFALYEEDSIWILMFLAQRILRRKCSKIFFSTITEWCKNNFAYFACHFAGCEVFGVFFNRDAFKYGFSFCGLIRPPRTIILTNLILYYFRKLQCIFELCFPSDSWDEDL